jgi:hypothetical protein
MWDELTQSYITVVPDELLNEQVGLSPTPWDERKEPVGIPSPLAVALSQNNSMSERGRGDVIGAANIWEQTTANIFTAAAQTGINVYAARNGVYSSALPQNTMSNASPSQLRQTQQAKNQSLLIIALIVGAIYVMGK